MQKLRELLGSKKVISAIVAVVTVIAAKYGFRVDTETIIGLITLFGILIGAQGATDFGKEAAKIQADAAVKVAESNKQTAIIASGANVLPTDQVVTQPIDRGFASLDLLVTIAMLSIVVGVVASCSWFKREASSVGHAVIDCTAENATKLTSQFGPTVDMLLLNVADSNTGQLDWAPLKAAGRAFATDAAKCVLANVIASHLKAPVEGGPQSSPVQLDAAALRTGFADLSRELYGGQSFKTKDGVL